MNLRTGKFSFVALIMAIMMVYGKGECAAQAFTFNPVEVGLLFTAKDSLTKNINQKTGKEVRTAGLLTPMAMKMQSIASWEQKMSSYLKDVKVYVQQAKAGIGIYTNTIQVLLNLVRLKKAIESNPEGIIGEAVLNEAYIKVAIEITISFALLKQVFSKGGDTNMLNGKDRAQVWWDLNDSLVRLNNYLYDMAYQIAYYKLRDIWNDAIGGMLQKSHGRIAREVHDQWYRRAKALQTIN